MGKINRGVILRGEGLDQRLSGENPETTQAWQTPRLVEKREEWEES